MDPSSKDNSSTQGAGISLGVDVGVTLAKIVLEGQDGALQFEFLPSSEIEALVERVQALAPERIGITGAGAARLADRLDTPCDRVDEFVAWGRGARQLLANTDVSRASRASRFLLVSLGTGTSILLMDGTTSLRVGGTALGGGTILGLGAGLLATSNFETLCELAAPGDRSQVDLVVSDIYQPGEIDLPDNLTAASFGKLGQGKPQSSQDLASAIMGLVGENVGLICAGLSYATQVDHIVYGGSTLRNNPCLRKILSGATQMVGRTPEFLDHGEYGGAVGALISATS